jgi:hypothetical protein
MRDIFDEAIGTSPVSTVDVDAVVARGRRRVSRHRFAMAGATTGVVVVTGVVAALALATFGPASGARSQPGLGLGPTAAPPGGSAAHPDGSAPVRDGETPEQTKQRLAAALGDGLTAALPGVRVSDGPTGQPGVVVHRDPASRDSRYDSDTVITVAAREGEVFLESWPGGRIPSPDRRAGQPAPPMPVLWIEACTGLPAPYQDCEASIGPAGQTIVVLSTRIQEGAQSDVDGDGPDAAPVEGGAGVVAFHEVYVTWTNAKVHLTVASDTKRGTPDAVAVPPLLSRQQLVAIAVDPDLTVTG